MLTAHPSLSRILQALHTNTQQRERPHRAVPGTAALTRTNQLRGGHPALRRKQRAGTPGTPPQPLSGPPAAPSGRPRPGPAPRRPSLTSRPLPSRAGPGRAGPEAPPFSLSDLIEAFRAQLRDDPDVASAVAAIRALLGFLKRDRGGHRASPPPPSSGPGTSPRARP